ncbi:hypothetical protein GALL_536490 [mine drainage metagenome]|uniref:Nitrate reductase gamma subunit n=1 Tax=mine drainage metagenome TaxID=410659 RepID=A0A1J5P2C5_9ZZZZ
MDLITFARGAALNAAFTIFIIGIAWRLFAIFRHPLKKDLSAPRTTRTLSGAIRTICSRMVPHREFRASTRFSVINGYVFHLGLAIIVFGFLPHIVFITRLTGISWPALPNGIVYLVAAITIMSLLIAFMVRINNPVLALLSNFDDYFSWLVTMLPLATGMVALGALGESASALGASQNGVAVAVHLLSFELLLIWLPFGKLAHAVLVFVSRGTTGSQFARKGART